MIEGILPDPKAYRVGMKAILVKPWNEYSRHLVGMVGTVTTVGPVHRESGYPVLRVRYPYHPVEKHNKMLNEGITAGSNAVHFKIIMDSNEDALPLLKPI